MPPFRSALFAVVLAGATAFAQIAAPPTSGIAPSGALSTQVAALLRDPAVSRAHWGIAVMSLEGTPIFSLDEGKVFRPASTAKLFTTAAAMALLGPASRVETLVTASSAPDAAGLIHGDLTFHGVGDANLSGRNIPYESPAARRARLAATSPSQSLTSVPAGLEAVDDLAAQVAASGVKSIDGAIIGDASLWPEPRYAPSWDAGDAPWGYGASITALAVNDNKIQVRILPGPNAGDPATIQTTPESVLITDSNITTVNTQALAGVDAVRIEHGVTLHGAVALAHPDVEQIAVSDPALFAAQSLHARLIAHGVAIVGNPAVTPAILASTVSWSQQLKAPVDLTRAKSERTECDPAVNCFIVARRLSPTLAEDVTVTLKESQNLHAEMLLRRLARAYGSEGSFTQGVRVLRGWLLAAGLRQGDLVFYDGSGLSSHDLVTPRAEAQLLAYASKQTWFAQWKAALPIGGVDGTLASRFLESPLKGRVFAKTGTLGESRALAGFVQCASGQEVIFSIMVDNHEPESSADRVTMDKIVEAIAASN